MTISQLEKELIKHTKGLPKEALKEIVDFAQFIRQKRIKKSDDNISGELSTLSYSQAVHLEEEFRDYKKLYPLE